ncbi:hypothetical protein C5Y96_16630 [Blastopirellula marina]|uniref:Uncharacterized protein n=1 Tax=Blastopirellula marina TaxID=124 RepID=A0A2S8F771_9BACT|nr:MULTISPECIES: DUF6572 domain-containing protein [Pirellulaceae]PQO28002.1 hypothetical protein C5Y96_16630 [Blastopirellula marina]RCS48427.1 hypothetical protein DTL36_16650 [Bremerella cremea]
MALAKKYIIDAVGICKQTGSVVVSLMDEEDWDEEDEHIKLLQDKLATYLRFIESGDMQKAYPKAQGRTVRIEIRGRCRPSEGGQRFLDETAERIRAKGIDVQTSYESPWDSFL